MRETYQNILNVIIIVFLLAAAILFYNQQKNINQLSSLLKNQNNATSSSSIAPSGEINVDKIDRDQKNSEAKVKAIGGTVVSISGNDLTVEADMPDWQKMKEPRGASKPVLTYKKTYTVTTDGKTQFSANKLDGIKTGDTIMVASKELVYQTDKLTAVLVASPSALPSSWE